MGWLSNLLDLFRRKPNPPKPIPPNPVPVPGDWRTTLLESHNNFRAANRLPPLKLNGSLNAAAQDWSDWMAANRTLTHTGNGQTVQTRVESAGYGSWTGLAENIAAGQVNTAALMSSWTNSPDHRANILGPYADVGFGLTKDLNGLSYWCADFGKRGMGSPPAMLSGPLQF